MGCRDDKGEVPHRVLYVGGVVDGGAEGKRREQEDYSVKKEHCGLCNGLT